MFAGLRDGEERGAARRRATRSWEFFNNHRFRPRSFEQGRRYPFFNSRSRFQLRQVSRVVPQNWSANHDITLRRHSRLLRLVSAADNTSPRTGRSNSDRSSKRHQQQRLSGAERVVSVGCLRHEEPECLAGNAPDMWLTKRRRDAAWSTRGAAVMRLTGPSTNKTAADSP